MAAAATPRCIEGASHETDPEGRCHWRLPRGSGRPSCGTARPCGGQTLAASLVLGARAKAARWRDAALPAGAARALGGGDGAASSPLGGGSGNRAKPSGKASPTLARARNGSRTASRGPRTAELSPRAVTAQATFELRQTAGEGAPQEDPRELAFQTPGSAAAEAQSGGRPGGPLERGTVPRGQGREGPRGQGRRPASGAGGASLAVCVWLTDAPSACHSHPTPAARRPSPRSPCPRACVFHLLVYLYFCSIPRASEIMRYLPLSLWLLPPGTMPSRPIHTVAEGKVPFLFTAA